LWLALADLKGAFLHHGKFTAAREAIEAHHGEARNRRSLMSTPNQALATVSFSGANRHQP